MIARRYPTAALNETFTYDDTAYGNGGKGHVTHSQDAAGTTDYWYDAAKNRMTGETRTIGGYSHTVAYTYDGAGRLNRLTYPSGRQVIYDYDSMGRVNDVGLRRNSARGAIAATQIPPSSVTPSTRIDRQCRSI